MANIFVEKALEDFFDEKRSELDDFFQSEEYEETSVFEPCMQLTSEDCHLYKESKREMPSYLKEEILRKIEI